MYTKKTCCTIPVSRAMKRGLFCHISITSEILTPDYDSYATYVNVYPNNLMGQFLLMLQNKISYGLLELSSNSDKSTSTKTSKAILIIAEKDIKKAEEFVLWFQQKAISQHSTNNIVNKIQILTDDEEEIELVLDDYSQDRLITLLAFLPDEFISSETDASKPPICTLHKTRMHLDNEIFQVQISMQTPSELTYEYLLSKVWQLTEMMHGSISSIET